MHFYREIFVLSFQVLAIIIVKASVYTHSVEKSSSYNFQQECFIEALEKTQSCDNKNILYTTLMSGGGLGSEFNTYLVPSLITAVAQNRRLVYVRPKENWAYDCSIRYGWACYFKFSCEGNGIDMASVDQSQVFAVRKKNYFQNMTSVQLLSVRNHEILKVYSVINSLSLEGRERSCAGKVNTSSLPVTMLMSMAARFLYQFNSETKSAIEQINRQYDSSLLLQPHIMPYLSMQIRMTDKRREMPPETWNWITDLSNVANFIRPYFKAVNTTKLYAVSDNCTAVRELETLLLPDYHVYSPCFTISKSTVVVIVGKRNGGQQSAFALFADIEMLRRGAHFFGLFESNIVRMIHRLRFPLLSNSHPLHDPRRRFRDMHNIYPL